MNEPPHSEHSFSILSIFAEMSVTKILLLSLLLLALAGCKGPKKQNTAAAMQFEMPVPPAMLSDPSERSEYMLAHWWDNYSAATDSVSLEQAFANWAALAMNTPHSISTQSLIKGYDRDSARIAPLAEKYLYDPNSPYRDEDIYGALLSHIGGSRNLAIARLCELNAVGSKASDFVFEDARGRKHTLYGTDASYTLLFFSTPGCNACRQIIERLEESGPISDAVSDGRVKVLSIYIDEDLEAWRDYLPNYPAKWICGFDPLFTLRDDTLYHIRAIPSLYLLDKDKTVLLKDAPQERLIGVLEYLLQQ